MNTESYIYGTSFYHRFDVRPKLLFTLLYSVAVFFVHSWYGLSASILLPAAVFFISLGGKELWKAFLRLLPVLVLLVVFLPLQERDGRALFSLSGLVLITREGLERVCRLAVRFSSLSLALMLLMFTERSENIIRGLRFYHLPYSVSLLLSMILRFIPFLGAEFEEIRDAMSLRLNESKRGFPVMPSITAFTVAAVRMIPDTAAALEERGYGRSGRTEYGKLEYAPGLLTQFAISAIVPVIFVVFLR